MSRAGGAFAAVLLAAGLLAGCGGDGEGAGVTSGEVPVIAGTLTYEVAGGRMHEMGEPVHGECVSFAGAAVSIDNRTDATAHLRDGCDGAEGDVIIPDATWKQGNGPPATAVVMLRH